MYAPVVNICLLLNLIKSHNTTRCFAALPKQNYVLEDCGSTVGLCSDTLFKCRSFPTFIPQLLSTLLIMTCVSDIYICELRPFCLRCYSYYNNLLLVQITKGELPKSLMSLLITLPYEVLACIVGNVSIDDVFSLGLTCKALEFLITEDSICKSINQVRTCTILNSQSCK